MTLALCLSLLPTGALAAGETGWALDDSGVLTIDDKNGMTNWVNSGRESVDITQVRTVKIEDGVNEIGPRVPSWRKPKRAAAPRS